MNKESKYKVKLNLFRIKKFIEGSIAVDIDADYSESDMKFIDELESAAFQIKTIENDRIYNLYELKDKGKTSYPSNFWKEELIQKYRLFIIMLGIIDGKINYVVENENTINSITNLIDYRADLVKSYNEFITIKNISEIDNAIKNYPVDILIDDLVAPKSIQSLYYEFYKKYQMGKNLSKDINFDLISDFYQKIIENVKKNKEEKNKNINKTRK